MENSLVYLSIIVPVYNSGPFLNRSLSALDDFIKGLKFNSELIIVDDKSTDNSLAISQIFANGQRPYPVKVTQLAKNFGKGAGVANGMLAATGEYRVFLDADLAYDPSQILNILDALKKGADVAVASRVHKDSRYTISPAFFHYLYTRHIASRLINWFMRQTIIPHCHDSQAGLKGFSARAAREIFKRQKIQGFSFDIEALYLAEKLGFKLEEVPIEYRYFSEPTTVEFVQDGLGIVIDIAKIKLNAAAGRYGLSVGVLKKRIIINADDFGMTSEISRGILECVRAGSVSSFSVMTNSKDFDVSMDEFSGSNLNADVGFHSTLTWGEPAADPKNIPTLVGKDGRFLSAPRLMLNSFLGKVSEDETYLELDAQCAKLAAKGVQITHIDGHHHVHAYPVICRAAEKVARKYGIKCVRAPREGLWSSWYAALLRRLPMMLISSASPKYWRGRGFVSSDNFGGYFLSGGPDLQKRWDELLKNLPYGTTEIMVHPGYESENKDAYNVKREDELNLLKSSEFIDKFLNVGKIINRSQI